jgi:hypothetical protein
MLSNNAYIRQTQKAHKMAKLTGKAKANARKKAQAIKNAKAGIPNLFGKKHNFKTGMVFTVMDEFNKLVKITTDSIVPYSTKSTLADFNAMTFKDGEGGFLITLIPRNGNDLVASNTDVARVQQVLSNFKVVPLNQYWAIASCYCTKDRVLQHLDDIVDTLQYAFVGYSQPNCIAPLSEIKRFCEALRDQTDPIEHIKMLTA